MTRPLRTVGRGRVPGMRELVIPKTPFIVPYRLAEKCHSNFARLPRGRWPESRRVLFRVIIRAGLGHEIHCR
jgi:hypothetical protein